MIQLIDVCKTFPQGTSEIHVLKKINLTINAGEFVSIMGRSGSGKSTLMNIIGCLDTPTMGSYLLDDKNTSQLSEDELSEIRNQKIGFVFQNFELLPKLSVLQNAALPLVCWCQSGRTNDSSNSRLRKCRIKGSDRFPYQLSDDNE